MPAPRLHVLAWDQPLPAAAASWLARAWSGVGPLDLSDALVVVPTRQSGRRLREVLAAHAAARDQAVFPPRVLPSEGLLAEAARAPDVATWHDALLAWIEILRATRAGEFSELFPVEPPQRSFAWAARLARQLLALQATLAENGLRLADVPARAGDFPETARWSELATLEARHDEALRRRGLRDPQAAEIAFAHAPVLPPAVRRIVVLATPDPRPLALALLGALARDTPVDVLVCAPPDEPAESLFDDWGRPRVEVWTHRLLALDDFENHVHLCADPAAQAAKIVAWARAYGSPEGALGIGLADPEIAAPLHYGLGQAGLAAHDPEGRPRRGEQLHRLVELLATFAREPAFETAAALARCPDVLAWLRARTGGAFSAARLLAGLDELNTRHLPATLDDARDHAARFSAEYPELAPVLDAFSGLRASLTSGTFAGRVATTLGTLFAPRQFSLAQPDHARAVETASAWMDVVREIATAAGRHRGLEPEDLWQLALEAFGETLRFEEKPAGALELQGWLELLWEDAPHLVVAGLNDGFVPAAIVGDAFLPEALREKLGLKTNAARFARDAYLLQALAAARARSGRLDLLFGKVSSAGEPLRPSRLLMLCDDAALAPRVQFLFRAIGSTQATLPWQRAWRLAPAADRRVAAIAVTGFRRYLQCPFRFYLERALRMEPVDPHKLELDARDFGTLCHRALEALARDAHLRDSSDAGVLRTFLLGQLDQAARELFGETPPVPLLVQLESARQRLARAAEVQALERAAGWAIERTEWRFAFDFGGISVRGTIDRIDRHAATGAVRVLDYKTSDTAVPPRSAHVRTPGRRNEGAPDFARFEIEGKELVWTDLQLPLYLHAVRAEFGDAVACGYFNLPKAAGETAVATWTGYDATWQAAAMRCAEGVADAIAAGRFWPPAEVDPDRDPFAALFHHGAAASIAWPSAPEAELAETAPLAP